MQKKISNKVSKIGINGRREHLKHNERNLLGKRKKQRGYQPRPNGKTGYSHPRHMPRTRFMTGSHDPLRDDSVRLIYKLCNAGVDVNNDPQTTYFHPYAKLEDVFSSIGKSYSKHWREIKDIVFKLTWTDFEQLYRSGRCISFKSFYDAIFN